MKKKDVFETIEKLYPNGCVLVMTINKDEVEFGQIVPLQPKNEIEEVK